LSRFSIKVFELDVFAFRVLIGIMLAMVAGAVLTAL
jgi:hypothetical protein